MKVPKFKRLYLIAATAMLLFIVLAVLCTKEVLEYLKAAGYEMKSTNECLKDYLNKDVEIHNDTFKIVNYSVFSEELILSNGVGIKKEVADRCLINSNSN